MFLMPKTTTNTYVVVVIATPTPRQKLRHVHHKVTVKVTNVEEEGKVAWTVDPDGTDGVAQWLMSMPGTPIMQFQARRHSGCRGYGRN